MLINLLTVTVIASSIVKYLLDLANDFVRICLRLHSYEQGGGVRWAALLTCSAFLGVDVVLVAFGALFVARGVERGEEHDVVVVLSLFGEVRHHAGRNADVQDHVTWRVEMIDIKIIEYLQHDYILTWTPYEPLILCLSCNKWSCGTYKNCWKIWNALILYLIRQSYVGQY